jgi:hypothetical protein
MYKISGFFLGGGGFTQIKMRSSSIPAHGIDEVIVHGESFPKESAFSSSLWLLTPLESDLRKTHFASLYILQ